MAEQKNALVIGKQYNFNNVSTSKVTVNQVIEHYIIFHEKYLEFCGEYKATYLNEEDEQLGCKKDIDRHHKWVDFISRRHMCSVEMYRWADENLWGISLVSVNKVNVFYFHKEEKAKMYMEMIKEYIFW